MTAAEYKRKYPLFPDIKTEKKAEVFHIDSLVRINIEDKFYLFRIARIYMSVADELACFKDFIETVYRAITFMNKEEVLILLDVESNPLVYLDDDQSSEQERLEKLYEL